MADEVNQVETPPEKGKKGKKTRVPRPIKLFPANKKGMHIMHFLNFIRLILFPWNSVIYPSKIYGPKKVDKGACIFIGNHFSMWDVLIPARATWEGIHYLSKASLTQKPILGGLSRSLGVIPAKRDGSDVRALMDAMKCLKNGEKVSLFPEGKRNKVSEEEFLPFHGGAAMMAIKTKTPIIPFVICRRPRIFRITHVVFGEPIVLSEYYDRKLAPEEYDKIDEFLRDRLYALREEHRAGLKAKKESKKKKKCK